jgi:aryl-alcohol dehydrogenase-like predicted oxidoreductase
LLTGRYRRDVQPPPGARLAQRFATIGPETFDRVTELERCARERNLSLLQYVIRWLAVQSCVGPVITGATTPEQIRANALAGDWQS